MEREEAALRAKIQAVKNLLAAKKRGGGSYVIGHGSRVTMAPYASYNARKPVVPVHKTWTRANVAPPPPIATVHSANKVWVNKNAVRTTPPPRGPAPSPPVMKTPPSGSSFAPSMRSRMQMQMLRLEDGEYAKANGGFSLVRSDVMKAKAAEKLAAHASPHTGSVVRRPSLSTATAASRAQAAVARARAARGKPKPTRVRTEYCRFFNKFGYCNNKNACKFLHDGRHVALCRKFARGSCEDADCKLSHDKNKMPVCTMFLRGACTRDDCRFRHVKVSGSAQVCEAFLKGYCPQGETCPFKHERPKCAAAKRPLSSITNVSNEESPLKLQKRETASSVAVGAPGTSPLSGPVVDPNSASAEANTSSSLSSVSATSPLSIRPNILFAPRHGGAMPSLLSLRKKQPLK